METPATASTGTVKAVKLFQADAGLTVDGIAGIATQGAIEIALEAKKTPAKKKTDTKTDAKAEAKARIKEYIQKILEELEAL